MTRRALAICVLLAFHPAAGQAWFDEEKLVREYAKTLAKDKDAKDRADAARWLGGRKHPEAVAALACEMFEVQQDLEMFRGIVRDHKPRYEY